MMPENFHIVSYPRSGSHLVRTLLEASFLRPTLGCQDAGRDTPIAHRTPNLDKKLIALVNENPIGLKSHNCLDVLKHEHKTGQCNGFILIARDPVDAISSHIYRAFRNRRIKPLYNKDLRRSVNSNVDAYLSVLHLYKANPAALKIHLEFEQLVNLETNLAYVNAFIPKVGCEHAFNRQELNGLLSLSKESQGSLKKVRRGLMSDIRGLVSNVISYGDVRNILKL